MIVLNGRRRFLPDARRLRACAGAFAVLALGGCTGANPGVTSGDVPPSVPLDQVKGDPAPLAAKLDALKAPETVAPAPGETYIALGKRLLAAHEPDLAMRAFVASMSSEGVTPEALTGAGLAAESQGMMTMARRYFEKARDLAPNSVVAQNNLGVVLYRLREYDQARDAFRTAYALSSGTSEMAERNLNLAEARIDELGGAGGGDVAATHEVVRLGTSEFRLIETRKDGAETTAAD